MAKSLTTYKQMQLQLDELVELLRSHNDDIDISIKQYEEAMRLIKDMEAYLKTAENKVTKIKKDFSV